MARAAGLILLLTLMASPSTAGPAQGKPRDLNTYHLFLPPQDLDAWEKRAAALRRQILFSAGLQPMPPKTPMNPRVTGRIEGPDFIVENVALETFPGFFLAGNLYRPRGAQGRLPAIVNPHGHWQHGRLEMEPDVPRAPEPPGPMGQGRANLVAIGVNLARQGYVVFAYDMVGYNDTTQVDHRYAGGLRPWLWNVSLMGLQLWNSIRVVDYLVSRPDVDARRIGVTGASGGGTQTFLLTAVDPRIRAAVPVNMVSATMQGGCLCENGPGLRLGTDNAEIAALAAPRPLLLIAATGDWTRENPTSEWPAIWRVYELYAARDATAVRRFNYQHNYNIESREAMYAWFARHLLGDARAERYRERPFTLDARQMRVWTDSAPMPPGALKEPDLIQAWIRVFQKQIDSIQPEDRRALGRVRSQSTPLLKLALGIEPPQAEASANAQGASLAAVVATAQGDQPPAGLVEGLERAGYAVSRVDLLRIDTTAEALWADFYTCYNRSPLGDRVQTLVNAIAALRRRGARRVDVLGFGQAGLWSLFARAVEWGKGHTLVDTAGLDNQSDDAYIPGLFAPGLRRAGGITVAALLAGPDPLCLMNTADRFQHSDIAARREKVRAPTRAETGTLDATAILAWLAR